MRMFPRAGWRVDPGCKGAGNRDAEVSRNSLVQLFFLSSPGSVGSRYEHGRTKIRI